MFVEVGRKVQGQGSSEIEFQKALKKGFDLMNGRRKRVGARRMEGWKDGKLLESPHSQGNSHIIWIIISPPWVVLLKRSLTHVGISGSERRE
jgi:hypothetical protein